MAKAELESKKHTNQQIPRKQSQSSYVEMNPEDMVGVTDDPYMSMEN